MTDPLHDEMLSAYLDGELSAEEQAEVERRLAEEPESRQLLEELRAMSGAIQAMPRHKLGEEFRDQVLRRAERAMLTEPVRPRDEPEDERRATLPIGRSLRPLIWAGLTIAAAILLMFYDGNQDADNLRVAKQAPARPSRLPADMEIAAPHEDLAAVAEGRVARALRRPTIHVEDEATLESLAAPVEEARSRPLAATRTEASEATDTGEIVADAIAPGKEFPGEELPSEELPGEELLVVQLSLSSEAAESGAFQQLLLNNSISWEEEEDKREFDDAVVPQQDEPGGVLVEASYRQVEQILQDAQAQPTKFLTIAVDPAPADVTQQPLAKYTRSGMPGVGGGAGRAAAPAFGAKAPSFQGADSLRKESYFSFDKPLSKKTEAPSDAKQKKDISALADGQAQQQAWRARAQRVKLPEEFTQQTFGGETDQLAPDFAVERRLQRSLRKQPASQAMDFGSTFQRAVGGRQSRANQPLRVLFLLRVAGEPAGMEPKAVLENEPK